MKKFLRIFFMTCLLLSVVILTGFINHTIKEEKCKAIVIDITDQERYGFISEGDITDLLNNDFNTPISQKIRDISTFEIEKKLLNHQAVQNAEVYISIDGKLNIKIWQRKPILRVFNKHGSFYIDEFGKIMPVTKKFTAHVAVASGNIDIPVNEIQKFQQEKVAKTNLDTSLYNDLFELARFIESNPLWNAQIEQLYVNKDSEFELIPRVGNHTIVIGEVHDLENKFKKLQLFYRKGLSKTGWNEYKEINLKFKNQIVCTKRY